MQQTLRLHQTSKEAAVSTPDHFTDPSRGGHCSPPGASPPRHTAPKLQTKVQIPVSGVARSIQTLHFESPYCFHNVAPMAFVRSVSDPFHDIHQRRSESGERHHWGVRCERGCGRQMFGQAEHGDSIGLWGRRGRASVAGECSAG